MLRLPNTLTLIDSLAPGSLHSVASPSLHRSAVKGRGKTLLRGVRSALRYGPPFLHLTLSMWTNRAIPPDLTLLCVVARFKLDNSAPVWLSCCRSLACFFPSLRPSAPATKRHVVTLFPLLIPPRISSPHPNLVYDTVTDVTCSFPYSPTHPPAPYPL